MEAWQPLFTNALRILLYCIVLWSLIFWLMSRLRIPDRYLDGFPILGRNIIVIGLMLCVAAVQFLFNGHWRAALDSRWWTRQVDWFIAFFVILKLIDSLRIRTKASKAAAAEQAERRRQRKKGGPTPSRKKEKNTRRSLG